MVEDQAKALGTKARPLSVNLLGLMALIAVSLAGPSLVARFDHTTGAYAQSIERVIGFADIVDKIKPAVMSVSVKIDAGSLTASDGNPDESPLERFFRRFGSPNGGNNLPTPRGRGLLARQGSGFFISADGYAVTNGHVVEKAKTVDVTTDSGKAYVAKVVGVDLRSDIALIKVDGGKGVSFPFVKFADKTPRVGDWVLAVGNPFGLGGTVTAGIVSARGRDIGAGPYDDFIQIDAPVNRGNSGGPTFDIDGNVIGVNTAIVSPSGGSVGIGFAIPADSVKPIIDQLREKGTVTRGWIGVQIQDITPEIADSLGLKEARGALIADPEAGGPAAKAGIASEDVVIAVNDKEIGDSRELARTISGMPPGASAKLKVIRKGQERTIDVILGTLPDQREVKAEPETSKQRGTSVPQLGLTIAPHSGGGVVVSKVDPDGLASDVGLINGDVILEVAGRKVGNASDVRNAVDAARKSGKNSVLMRVKSGNAVRYVAVPVNRG
jgi:serine protease Do